MSEAGKFMKIFDQIPPEVAGEKMIQKRDYFQRKYWDLLSGQEHPIELPCSKAVSYTHLDVYKRQTPSRSM